jgi:HPt (histidine-containing phosphotransfer) domain-containing protein
MAQTLLRWLGATHDAATSEPCPAAPPQAASAAIDDSVIEGLRALDRKGGPSRLVRAVSRFLEVAPALAASVKAAADNGDAEALWRAAHSLKSSAAALGAQALSKRCAEIEARARDSGLAAALPLVPGLDDDLKAATAGLEALIGEIHVPA